MGNKNIIELNGKRYDAASGELLGAATIAHNITPTKVYPKGHTGRTLDVFARAAAKATPAKAVHKPASILHHVKVQVSGQQQAVQTHKIEVRRVAANHAKAHKTQGSRILMRTAVKKPGDSLKKHIHVQTELTKKVSAIIVPKTSVNNISPHRLERAHMVARSQHISHYGKQSSLQVNFQPLEVKTAPPQPSITAPKPQPSNQPKPTDVFEHAIARADNFVDLAAHKAHFKKQFRRHVTSVAAGTLALVLLGGFLAYQNMPGVQLKVASFQAGFSTHMPNFKASGFAYNGIKQQDGQLTIGFKGNGNTYQLTQQQTNWTADEMIRNVSSTDASGIPDYTTVQAGDTTIYRLASNSATWISGGKWYQVNGSASLSDTQLKSLVSHV